MTLLRCFVLCSLLCSLFLGTASAMEEDMSPTTKPNTTLTSLPNEVLLNTMVHVPTPDLLSLYKNSKGNTANKTLFEMARYELINRGGLVTFSMETMTQEDLPFLMTFLQNRAHAPHFTISHLNGNLLFQALEALRQHDSAFSFKTLKALKTWVCYDNQNIATELLAFAPFFLPHLTSLDLSESYILDDEVIALANSSYMAQLTSLYLYDTEIGNAAAIAIAQSPHMARLTSLNLAINEIGVAGAIAIANSSYMARLSFLNLSWTGIGDAGAAALANSPHMAKLTSLNLGYNTIGIGDAGAIAIAQSPHMANLTFLNLGYDIWPIMADVERIADAGAIAIANSAYMAQLTSLSLEGNKIEDAGAIAIRQSPHMANLTFLNLSYTETTCDFSLRK